MPISSPTLLPWHAAVWKGVDRARRSGRLPHALLVTGPAGVGKRRLVALLAGSLLCVRPDPEGMPCGACRECALRSAGTHPDLLEIGPDPESKSDEIKVESIRGLAGADSLTAHRGGRRVVVLDPAHNMNMSAANGLLKTLEEPSPGTILFLVSEHESRLPATIRSRCQGLKVPVPDTASAVEWLRGQTGFEDPATLLRLAHGAPLRALDLADGDQLTRRNQAFDGFCAVARGDRDPVAEATAWNKLEPAIVLEWLSGWISDLMRLATGHTRPRLTNPDKVEALRNLAGSVDPAAGHGYLREVLRARQSEDSTVNRLLLYEWLLVEWAGIAGRRNETVGQRGL